VTLEERFAGAMADLAGPERSGPFGIAVSGGGDSVALMALAADWARTAGVALRAATVNHGLRAEAADEARGVAMQAAAMGLAHDTLTWRWDGCGNLQDAARRGRMRLLADWAAAQGLAAVLLGHTRDDIAETFLMRLARGSGVDGLSAMAARRAADGTVWLRPLLGIPRDDLRRELLSRGLTWIEDPSNEDPRFDRARARQVLGALAPLGISAETLAATAGRLASTSAVLRGAAAEAAARVVRQGPAGEASIDSAGLADLPADIARRVFAGVLVWIASADYPPRHEALEALAAGLRQGRGGTLHGCIVSVAAGTIVVCREAQAVAGMEAPAPGLWDRRWLLDGPAGGPGLTVRALGEAGLALCPDWRATGAARAALIAGPAVWLGERLVAAPLAGRADGWTATLQRPIAAAFTVH
jgi:tRNA(Ile)-lysidine synthase